MTFMDTVRDVIDRQATDAEDWQGRPTPLEDMPVTLYDGHPLAATYARFDAATAEPAEFRCSRDDMDEVVVNSWFSYSKHAQVYVVRNTRTGRTRAVIDPVSPDQSMDRLTLWMRTVGAADAWKLEAEFKARQKLRGLIGEHHYRQYELTGSFFETSRRSGVTYMFRRLRPTVALTSRWRFGRETDTMRCLAVLCLHPVGYYQRTWAGCMTPTDDVIAHVLLMRGDEAGYWKQANQHQPWAPEAGL